MEKNKLNFNQICELTKEDLAEICDCGLYNAVISGYLIQAMRNAGFQKKSINKALRGLQTAFDFTSAEEAEEICRKF